MQVLGEGLAPGVQEEGRADLAAQPAGVGAEFKERIRGGVEQQPVEDTRIALRECVERVWQREDEVEVRHRQQFRPPRLEPALLRPGLALRAVPVAAGVVAVAPLPTGITLFEVAAQDWGATRRYRAQRTVLH